MPLTRVERRALRRARARVVQALYAWDVTRAAPLVTVASNLWDDIALGTAERERAAPLIRTASERAVEIDELLAAVASNWRLERLGGIERAILRAATAELMMKVARPKITLQEAVTLAERYSGPESARFVNGVLDALARRLGRV
ncbi:MAG: transcription antitermination factor NusB [Gemmatimonadota bacterium]